MNTIRPTLAAVPNVRRCKNWIDSFEQYCQGKGSPDVFIRWAGIFTLAAALERRVWIKTSKGTMFPNMYVFLVGPPGAGKTLALEMSREFLGELDKLHLAPTSVTKASMIDALDAAKRHVIVPKATPPTVEFNSLTVVSNELGTFLTAYEADFMSLLTELWDSKKYSETRRSSKLNIQIEKPQVSILAATTPAWLNGFLPEGAWEQGFLARVMLAYSGAEAPGDLFGQVQLEETIRKDLAHDIKQIFNLYGEMAFEPEAAMALTAWHKYSTAGGPPVPDHPKLTNYGTRRTSHLLRLCMVACVSRGEELIITLDDYVEALNWLTELEHTIPDIFKSMKSANGDGKVMEEAYYYVYKSFVRDKKEVSEQRLMAFLSERTPAHNVERIIKVMTSAGLIERRIMTTGYPGYKPGAKD